MEVLEGKRKKEKGESLYLYAVAGALVLTLAYSILGGGFALWTADQRAYASYKNESYIAAAEQFSDPMWRGVSYFKQGDFKKAATVFSGIQSADGFYNHGNSLVMLGKYADAISSYDRALALGPHADAELNRTIAKARMDALDFEGGNMTDGKIGSDGITFEKGTSSEDAGEEVVEGGKLDDAQMREVWLRKVQTKPADFLKSKFMYQDAVKSQPGGEGE